MPDFGSFRGFGEKLAQGQTPTQLGTIGSIIFGSDPDAVAFFDRVIAAGGSLSATEQAAVNQLVLDMKSAGIWTLQKAIYPMVGASAAACAQNLKSASFTGTFNGGWTFASTGVTPNGSTGFFNTTFNNLTNSLLDSSHLSYYSQTATTGLQSEIGLYNPGTNNGYFLSYNYSGGNFKGLNAQSTNVGSAFTPSNGFLLANRNSSTTEKYYFKGVLSDTITKSSIALTNLNVYIGAHNVGGSASNFSVKECAFASIGDGLTDTEASNFYTAVQAFQTTLSRQV